MPGSTLPLVVRSMAPAMKRSSGNAAANRHSTARTAIIDTIVMQESPNPLHQPYKPWIVSDASSLDLCASALTTSQIAVSDSTIAMKTRMLQSPDLTKMNSPMTYVCSHDEPAAVWNVAVYRNVDRFQDAVCLFDILLLERNDASRDPPAERKYRQAVLQGVPPCRNESATATKALRSLYQLSLFQLLRWRARTDARRMETHSQMLSHSPELENRRPLPANPSNRNETALLFEALTLCDQK